jgi:hypothetical protein
MNTAMTTWSSLSLYVAMPTLTRWSCWETDMSMNDVSITETGKATVTVAVQPSSCYLQTLCVFGQTGGQDLFMLLLAHACAPTPVILLY